MNRNSENSSLFIGFFFGKITVFLLFAVVLTTGLLAQSQIKSNLVIFEQEISGELDKFFFFPQIERERKFVFWVSSVKKNKEEKKFIESVIKKSAEKNKLKIAFAQNENMDSPDSIYNKCRITIEKLNTDYTKLIKNGFLGYKSMQRRVTSELDIEISGNTGNMLVNDVIKTDYEDEIPYDDYNVYESSEYKFTQSVPPNISFLESILFPAAVVTLSAVAAILFFTIRTK